MIIWAYDAVNICEGTDQNVSIGWIVTGDPAGTVQLWRFRFGEVFEVKIFDSETTIGGFADDPVVMNPAPNFFNYRIRAINSDGVFVDQTVGPIQHFGTCIN